MTRVDITTVNGQRRQIVCPGVDPAIIDREYVDQRTPFEVDSITVDNADKDLGDAIRQSDTLDDLKDALVGELSDAQVKGRRPDHAGSS